MKRALIQGTRICEFVATEADQFPVHEGLQWVEVADDTTTEDTYENGAVVKYVAPTPGPIDEIRRLEREITNRRLRDAVLTPAGKTWLENQEALIAVERAKL